MSTSLALHLTWCCSSTSVHSDTAKYGSDVETMSVRVGERVSARSFSSAVSIS